MSEFIELTVARRTELTSEICELVLAPVAGAVLPDADAGAHLGVRTPDGSMRQYSLVVPMQAPDCYTIAVKRETGGRGGSLSIHTSLQEGDRVQVLPPQNNFAVQPAAEYLLIAGGIGITPIYAIAQALVRQGADVRMIYCARSAAEAAYLQPLQTLLGDRLTSHFDGGDAARVYDFWDHFAEPGKAHVYCCGPTALMEEIKGISGHWPDNSVHFEDFAGVTAVRGDDRPFEVNLQNSARTITVAADQSLLEALREAGVQVASSCESGTCGTCKCGLVDGEVEHRDMVLGDDERDTHIMVCVSRAAGERLTLAL